MYSRFTRQAALALFAIAALAGGAGPLAAQQPDLKKVRILLVVDTSDPNLRTSVTKDMGSMKDLVRCCIPKEYYELTVLTDKDATPDKVLAHYKALPNNLQDEALLFYYAGHGALDKNGGGHVLTMGAGNLFRKRLREEMQSHNPGLAVLLTDCCSNEADVPRTPRPKMKANVDKFHPVLRGLLFQHRGVVDVTGAADGTSSWGDDDFGGIFTRSFKWQFIDNDGEWVNATGFVHWQDFQPQLKKKTEETFSEWAEARRKAGATIAQTEQSPRAFELPERDRAGKGYALGVRVVNDKAGGVRITEVFAGTTAQMIGLEAGDRLLSIDGKKLNNIQDFVSAIDNSSGVIQMVIYDSRGKREMAVKDVKLKQVK